MLCFKPPAKLSSAIAAKFLAMEKYLRPLATLWALIGGGILFLLCIVTFFHVILHIPSLSGPLRGYEEMVRFGVGVAIFTFLPLCQLERKHIVVAIFFNKPSKTHRLAVDMMMASFAFFLFYAMAIGLFQLKKDNVVSAILGFSQWWFYIPALISLGLWAVIALLQCAIPLWNKQKRSF